MAPQVTYELLRSVFAEDQIVRVPEARVPASVTHAPTRAWFSDVGFPAIDNWLYLPPVWSPDQALQTIEQVDPYLDDLVNLPAGARRWIALGDVADDVLALDGASGRLWFFPNGEDEIVPSFDSVNTLSWFLYVLQRERILFYGPEDGEEYGDISPRAEIDRVREELRSVDPSAFADPDGAWSRLLQGFQDDWTESVVDGAGPEPDWLAEGEFWVPPHLR